MPNRIFVDTSFVLALINERDQYYHQAETLSYSFDNSLLITTNAVLLEIGNALAKNFRKEAIEIITALRNSKRVEVVQIDRNYWKKD
jgi:predicted nucleic acid-binding protein